MAQTTVNPYGIVIGDAEVFNSPSGADQAFAGNGLGDQRVVQHLPPRAELVRMGCGWSVRMATASAFTYVALWPTTRAEFLIVNNEPAGGKSYIMDRVWMYNITTQGAANNINLLAQLVPVVATAPADDTAQLRSSLNGRATYDGRMLRAVANTTAGQTTNLWDSIACGLNVNTASLGGACYADLFGLYIVPPQGVIAFAGVAGTAAGTATIGATLFEVQLTMKR